MNIFLIGASGFVSGTLARMAVEAGHAVTAVSRGKRPVPNGVKSVTVDRHDQEAFKNAIEEAGDVWDLVVDCIGYEVAAAHQDIEVFSSRAKHFVFVSMDFVFDPSRRTFPQKEDNPHFQKDGYGGKKRICELEFINGDTGDMDWTIIRPCHIYGPGSLLGCLPLHGRDADLLDKIKAGETLKLVGGGHFLQQPILAADLARTIFSCVGNSDAAGEIYNVAGPDIIESRRFYSIIGEILAVEAKFEEIPASDFLQENPGKAPFVCHRIYDQQKLQTSGLAVPSTPIEEGLRQHVESI